MRRSVAVLALLLFVLMSVGCRPRVRHFRTQKPFYQAPEGTKIALVDVQVPPWVEQDAPEDPQRLIKGAIAPAFDGSPYEVVDRTGVDYTLEIGPDTEPHILSTAARVANVGEPYHYDNNGRAEAYGAPPVRWEVVSGPSGFAVDAATGKVSWIPQQPGKVSVTLAAENKHGENRYDFTIQVAEQPQEIQHNQASAPRIGAKQAFAAERPSNVPADIEAPLLMSAHVVEWSEGSQKVMNSRRRTALTDVVYTVWTRDGKEVDTRRVRWELVPGETLGEPPDQLVPDWASWIEHSWEYDKGYSNDVVSADESKIFEGAARASAKAFAYPFGTRKVRFDTLLAEGPKLKAGLEKMDQENWQAAYAEFEKVLESNPNNAGAHYNMGVIREVQGRLEDAITHYEKAHEIEPNEGRYARQLDAARRRAKLREKVPLPASGAGASADKDADAGPPRTSGGEVPAGEGDRTESR